MKKYLALLLAAVMALSLVACGSKTDDNNTGNNGDAVSYSYDSFGRTTAVTYGDTGSTVSYTYDANSNLGQLTDGISGRVNRYSYDFLDRLMRYE